MTQVPPRRLVLLGFLMGSVAVGLTLGGFVMWAAWTHNNQGEIHEFGYGSSVLEALRHPSGVDWGYWLLLGAVPFFGTVGVATVAAALGSVLAWAVRQSGPADIDSRVDSTESRG